MRYKIELAYNGTPFHGWQIQPNAISVQQVLNEKLSIILQEKIQTMGSGRTDTGVHAKKQVVHCNITTKVPDNIIYRLNNILPCSIAVAKFEQTHNTFHARFDATSRAYEYLIHRGKSPFLDNFSYCLNKPLNIELMNQACCILKKHSDFECFSKIKTEVNNFICDIEEAFWENNKNELRFYIKANRFLRNMVRAIVGTLLEVGEEKISLNEFEAIIESKKRDNAGKSAPASGLYLIEVNYD